MGKRMIRLAMGITATIFSVIGAANLGAENITTVSGEKGTTFVFHDIKKNKAIHLGDDDGYREDISRYVSRLASNRGKSEGEVSEYLGDSYTRKFQLGVEAHKAKISVKIYSLVSKNHRFNCPTLLYVNGDQQFDLRDAEDAGESVGSRRVTNFSVEIPKLPKGENVIKIVEDYCDGSGMNDSLLLYGAVSFK